MKQQIKPGATLDIPTTQEMAVMIAGAFDSQRGDTYRRLKGSIQLDGTGAGTDSINVKAPRLYDIILERVSCTGVNALFQFFENQNNPSDLLEVVQVGAAGLYSDAFSNCIFLPAGSALVVQVTGGPASGSATYNIQAKLIKAQG